MFFGTEEILSLTDISSCDTSKVTNMNWLFFNIGLLLFPDI